MEERTNDEIFAEALIQIIKNQMELKKHLGIVRDTDRYGDCYYDRVMIDDLQNIK